MRFYVRNSWSNGREFLIGVSFSQRGGEHSVGRCRLASPRVARAERDSRAFSRSARTIARGDRPPSGRSERPTDRGRVGRSLGRSVGHSVGRSVTQSGRPTTETERARRARRRATSNERDVRTCVTQTRALGSRRRDARERGGATGGVLRRANEPDALDVRVGERFRRRVKRFVVRAPGEHVSERLR